MNNSLTKSEYYDDNPDFPADRCIPIINPLSKELNVMRQTLLYSGLECIARNINFRILDQKLYEYGHCYQKNSEYSENSKNQQYNGNQSRPQQTRR
jgi:phenylalanyl-tRNA synthetase beta chain